MGREILFRGKRKSDGKWIFGNLLQTDDDGTYIIQNHVPHHFLKNFEVDPESICQYTGLTDKNGRKIFEGDILRFENCSNYPVVWDDDYCAFGSCWYSDFDHLSKYRSIEIEVVGNIFDNPELLEEEE